VSNGPNLGAGVASGSLAVFVGTSIVQNILHQRHLNSYNYRRTEGWDSSRRRPGQN